MGWRRSAGGTSSGGGEGVSQQPPLPNGKTRWSSYYGSGAVMGFSPREVDDMTVWEFIACAEGVKESRKTEEDAPPPMGDEDLAALGIEGF